MLRCIRLAACALFLFPLGAAAFEAVDVLTPSTNGRYPAYPAEAPPLPNYWVQLGAMYDSNLLRRPTGDNKDTVLRLGAGARGDYNVIAYAGDEDASQVRRAGEVVISDSNRRRVLAAARMSQNHGWTLAADDPFSPDAAVLDLFPGRGSDGQTVATYEGARHLRMPFSPAYSQFPERRPFAAFDGDPATHWQADRALEEARHWLEIGFERPTDVDAIELMPYSDRRAKVTAVEVAGRTFPVKPGWNRLELGLKDAFRAVYCILRYGLVPPPARKEAAPAPESAAAEP